MTREGSEVATAVAVDPCLRLADLLTRISWRLRRSEKKELVPFGLTFAQARVMRIVGQAEEPMRIGDLATRLEIVPRSATTMVDGLEKAELVERKADRRDRRSVLLALTPQGHGLLERLAKARRASAHALFSRLTPEDQLALLELLQTLAGDSVEGACPTATEGKLS